MFTLIKKSILIIHTFDNSEVNECIDPTLHKLPYPKSVVSSVVTTLCCLSRYTQRVNSIHSLQQERQ